MTVATALLRLNVGCGTFPKAGYVNIDELPGVGADLVLHVPPLPFPNGSAEDIWACHSLEHLRPEEAGAFLAECHRVLVPGGRLGIVVPDTREILQRWLAGTAPTVLWEGAPRNLNDLDAVCSMFLYSTGQESPHQWSYDEGTLRRAIERAGFRVTGALDRHADPRLGSGAWYQCGFDSVRP